MLEPVASYDPRIDFDIEEELGPGDADKGYGDKYLVFRGAKNIDYFLQQPTAPAAGNISGTSDFNYTMPDRSAIIDRCIFLQADVTVKCVANGNAADNAPFRNQRFGLQAFPLHHCIKTLQLQIDSGIYSVDLTDSFEHLKYFNYTEDEIKTWSSLCPTLLDNSALFLDGASNNVLGAYKESGTSSVPPRGAFSFLEYGSYPGAADNRATGYVKYRVTEPIQLSPLILNAINQSRSTGMTGFSNMKIKITWRSAQESFYYGFNLNPYAEANVLGTIAASNPPVDGNPSAGVIAMPPANFLAGTVQPNLANFTSSVEITNTVLIIGSLTNNDVSICPPINSYEFMKYETHNDKSQNTPATRGTFTMNSQSYNLSQIPHAVLLAVVPQTSGFKYSNLAGNANVFINTVPDFYFGITNVNIKLGNRPGLLSNFPPQTLFEINRQNGLAFCNFSNSGMAGDVTYLGNAFGTNAAGASRIVAPQGCPLLLRFGKDVYLDDSSLAPGVSTNTTFQVTVTCNNPYAAVSTAQLVIIFIYDGIYTISNSGGSSYIIAPLSREDVLRSDTDKIDFTELEPVSGGVLVGGSWMGKLKKIGKKAYNFMKNPKVQKLMREGLNLADELNIPGASQVNAALNTIDNMRGNGMYRGGVLQNSSVVGGAVMTSQELRRRLLK